MHHMSRLLSVEEIEELNAEVDSLLDDMDQSFLDELEAVPSPYGIPSIQPIDPMLPALQQNVHLPSLFLRSFIRSVCMILNIS